MRVETPHSPHGREPYRCPKCLAEFEAYALYLAHMRRAHDEPRGLAG
jgi:uncharacterized C2H2 Zn-finger protein